MKGISKELILERSLVKNEYLKKNYNNVVKIIKTNYKYELVNKHREYYINDKYLDCEFKNGYLVKFKQFKLEYTLISNLWRKFISRIKFKENSWYMFVDDFIYQLLIVYSVSGDYLHKIDIIIDMTKIIKWIEKPVVYEEAIEYLRDTLYYFTLQLIITKQFTIYMHLRGSFFMNLQLWNIHFVDNKICYFYVVNTDINDPLQLGMCLAVKRCNNNDDNIKHMIISISKNVDKAYFHSSNYWNSVKYPELKTDRLSYIHNVLEFVNSNIIRLKNQYNVIDEEIKHNDDFRKNGDINGKIHELRTNMIHLPLVKA